MFTIFYNEIIRLNYSKITIKDECVIFPFGKNDNYYSTWIHHKDTHIYGVQKVWDQIYITCYRDQMDGMILYKFMPEKLLYRREKCMYIYINML